jgi:hypothetical protein
MARRELVEGIDPALMGRLATLSPGAQRWLKTAVQAIRTMPARGESDEVEAPRRSHPPQRRRPPALSAPRAHEEEEEPLPPNLEDVLTGKAKLEDIDQYPELSEELEGMGKIIDMLRGLGESRRKRGEQILREEILGQPAEDEEPAEDEDEFRF